MYLCTKKVCLKFTSQEENQTSSLNLSLINSKIKI